MSEYQYYEFHTIDKPLSEQDRQNLRAISTRARITATSFTNTYNWGDLKADPQRLLHDYFDTFIYVSSWGTRRFALRLPRHLVDVDAMSPYCGEYLTLHEEGEHVLLHFLMEELDTGGWEEGEGWMAELLPLRTDILSGDLRSLYIAWLADPELWRDEMDDDHSPPVPPGLNNLSAPLKNLAEFLQIDPDLLTTAQKYSAEPSHHSATKEEFVAWAQGLSLPEKDALIRRITEGDGPRLRAELLTRSARERVAKTTDGEKPDTANRPKINDILQEAQKLAAIRQEQQEALRKQQKEERARQDAKERQHHLKHLAAQGEKAWEDAENLIGSRQIPKYKQAARLLRDLLEIATEHGNQSACMNRIQAIRKRNLRKSAFIRQLDETMRPSQNDTFDPQA